MWLGLLALAVLAAFVGLALLDDAHCRHELAGRAGREAARADLARARARDRAARRAIRDAQIRAYEASRARGPGTEDDVPLPGHAGPSSPTTPARTTET